MRQQLTITVLAVLAVGSFLLLRGLEKTLAVEEENYKTREIATAYQVEGRYYGVDNQLQYEIVSESVSEYSNHGGTNFNMAKMRGFDAEKLLSWQGRSDVTLLSGDKKIITLTGKVKFIDAPSRDNEVRAYSESMVYFSDTEKVVGKEPSLIESNTVSQRASSFVLNLNDGTILFETKVNGSFLPATGIDRKNK